MRRVWHAVRHPIGMNAIALYLAQFATFVVPLITLPYLSRTLEPEGFGLVVLAQGSAMLLGLVIDFGFEFSAGRNTAAARDDPHEIGRIAARVMAARLLLSAVTIPFAVAAALFYPGLQDHPEMVALAWVAAIANGLSPGWFFVGVERLRLVSMIQLGTRIFGAVLTFGLVQDPGDGPIVLAIFALTSVATTMIMYGLFYRSAPAVAPRWAQARPMIREGRTLFVGTGAIALFSSANVVLLGLVAPAAAVARFAAAERVVRAGSQALGPVTLAIFPRISYLLSQGEVERARRLALIGLATLGGIGLAGMVFLLVLAGPIVDLVFGDGYEDAVPAMRIMAVLLPLLAVNQLLAGGWMMANRMDRDIVVAVVRAAAANVVLGLSLGAAFEGVGMACAVVAAELVSMAGCLYAIRRHERTHPVRLLSFGAMRSGPTCA